MYVCYFSGHPADHLLLVTSRDYCVSQYLDNASFPHCCTSWQMSCEKRDERMGENKTNRKLAFIEEITSIYLLYCVVVILGVMVWQQTIKLNTINLIMLSNTVGHHDNVKYKFRFMLLIKILASMVSWCMLSRAGTSPPSPSTAPQAWCRC